MVFPTTASHGAHRLSEKVRLFQGTHFWSWSTVDMQATLVHRPTSEEDYWTQLCPKDNAEMKKQLARACYVAGALGKAM